MQERGVAPTLSDRQQGGALRRSAITVAVGIAVVVVDQLVATWAVHRLSRGPVHVIGPLDLQLQINTGSAFGLAQGWAPVIAALAAVAVVVLVASSRRARSDGMAASVGLVAGGALGNLVDRVFRHYHGGVVDYVALHVWPTFNVADACITVGVVLVAWSLWRHAGSPSPSPSPSPGGAGPEAGGRAGGAPDPDQGMPAAGPKAPRAGGEAEGAVPAPGESGGSWSAL